MFFSLQADYAEQIKKTELAQIQAKAIVQKAKKELSQDRTDSEGGLSSIKAQNKATISSLKVRRGVINSEKERQVLPFCPR